MPAPLPRSLKEASLQGVVDSGAYTAPIIDPPGSSNRGTTEAEELAELMVRHVAADRHPKTP